MRDLITGVPTQKGSGDCGEFPAVATTNLITQQAAYHCTHAGTHSVHVVGIFGIFQNGMRLMCKRLTSDVLTNFTS